VKAFSILPISRIFFPLRQEHVSLRQEHVMITHVILPEFALLSATFYPVIPNETRCVSCPKWLMSAHFGQRWGNNRGGFVLEGASVDARPKKLRSGLTNNPHKLDGVDMRTQRGRRYRDIVDALITEFGPANPVGLRELAGLKFTLEQTQAAVVAGDPRAREDLVRISNLVARREREMRGASLSRGDAGPTLADIIAEHEGTAARP
jgi:hypothetical protein